MRVIIKLGVALLLFVLFGGLAVTSINRVRHAAKRISCANNLHSIGMALELYQDFHRHFPTGTVPNTELPPDRRLSWLVQIYPTFMVGGIGTRIEMTKPGTPRKTARRAASRRRWTTIKCGTWRRKWVR
jgi:hypothetical protein